MSKKIVIVIALILTVIVNALPTVAQRNRGRRMIRVDLLVLNGTLVTMDKDRRIIQDAGIAVEHGRIVAVGSSADIVKMYSAPARADAHLKNLSPGILNR